MELNNKQARLFLLRRHGLIRDKIFSGKKGIEEFLRRVGCVQFDPVDICGRNADIALHSRIEGYTKKMLDELLYKDRKLIDYFDKNLSIFRVEDFSMFTAILPAGGYAEAYDMRGGKAVQQIKPLIRRMIAERGHISAKDVKVDKKIVWHWGNLTSLPRAALESMYFRGELIIHHKTGTNKSYAFAKDHIPANILNEKPRFKTDQERIAWLVLRRIGGVGMLWNKPGDAFLGLRLKSGQRAQAFKTLLEDGRIFEVNVEGINAPFYVREDERVILEEVLSVGKYAPRTEFIAPLDSLIWDRRIIEALFGFEYRWEIYVPPEKRKYGPYTLPILYGDSFIGRADMARRDGTLVINNVWAEKGKSLQKSAAFRECVRRFAEFNGCDKIDGG